ncbi:MAG: Xaa-Pro dipeptidase [Kangiellaceae bacterium]|nr:Xaa-Pro dipeptidase [Kangiellaceae bacterium]MCW8999561.1 Xaa-Pro dipeptidase [Kangiellaceae bacterium]MCW9016373.1 Xaa-Pro dipeptidase [Kangiellaceae bacterium]
MADITELYSLHINDLLARHRQLMQQFDFEYLVIPSGAPIRIYMDDMDYPFKSSFHFRTYVPLTELPHSYLVIGQQGKPTLVYYQPEDYWHAKPSDPQGVWPAHFDVQVISDQQQASEFMPQDSSNVAVLGEHTAITSKLTLAADNPSSLINAIQWQRAYKSEYEIACMFEANRMAAKAHRVAEQAFRAGKSEQQIHLAYVEATSCLEHQMPYSNIVALNQNGAVLHYTECQAQAPQQSVSFLIDAGASFNGYHSDITRTYATEQNEFAELITAMDEMQRNCIASIQTNQAYLDLHVDAHLAIAAIIQRFGIVDMTPESMVESGVSATFFPHGLGHLIGLQVHDVGGQFADQNGMPNPPPESHPFLRTTRSMEPGMAFTIEPGLYFIDSLLATQKQGEFASAFNWSKIEALMPFGGIRIEDDIVVRQDSVLNMSRDAFAELD